MQIHHSNILKTKCWVNNILTLGDFNRTMLKVVLSDIFEFCTKMFDRIYTLYSIRSRQGLTWWEGVVHAAACYQHTLRSSVISRNCSDTSRQHSALLLNRNLQQDPSAHTTETSSTYFKARHRLHMLLKQTSIISKNFYYITDLRLFKITNNSMFSICSYSILNLFNQYIIPVSGCYKS